MTSIPYILDILSQPASLQSAVEQFDGASLAPAAEAIRSNRFDRIVLTGMGGSLNAAYPAWLALANAGLPALWVDTAELVHYSPALITARTLLWVFSQSGRSAEVLAAIDFERVSRPAALLATVNDLASPLAQVTQYRIPIHAEVEKTVSTRTYVNSLAVGQLAALALLGQDVEAGRGGLLQTAAAMESYLAGWEDRVRNLGQMLGFPKRLAILGRGPSLASAYAGTLILGEASKFLATPFQAGEFRHGPLELATPDLTVLLFAGPRETRELNLRLLKDLRGYQVNAFWIGPDNHSEWVIEIPQVPSIGLPLTEILPIQLLSIHLALEIGVEPGYFFRSGKITLSE